MLKENGLKACFSGMLLFQPLIPQLICSEICCSGMGSSMQQYTGKTESSTFLVELFSQAGHVQNKCDHCVGCDHCVDFDLLSWTFHLGSYFA